MWPARAQRHRLGRVTVLGEPRPLRATLLWTERPAGPARCHPGSDRHTQSPQEPVSLASAPQSPGRCRRPPERDLSAASPPSTAPAPPGPHGAPREPPPAPCPVPDVTGRRGGAPSTCSRATCVVATVTPCARPTPMSPLRPPRDPRCHLVPSQGVSPPDPALVASVWW